MSRETNPGRPADRPGAEKRPEGNAPKQPGQAGKETQRGKEADRGKGAQRGGEREPRQPERRPRGTADKATDGPPAQRGKGRRAARHQQMERQPRQEPRERPQRADDRADRAGIRNRLERGPDRMADDRARSDAAGGGLERLTRKVILTLIGTELISSAVDSLPDSVKQTAGAMLIGYGLSGGKETSNHIRQWFGRRRDTNRRKEAD